jgi:hypothetical protein
VVSRPEIIEIAAAGDSIDIDVLSRATESTGAVVHSIDELAAGTTR